MKKLVIYYEPTTYGLNLFSDGDMESYVNSLIERMKGITVLLTSQEMMINYVRLAICTGKISCDNVEFRFKGNIIFADRYGHLDWWPDGFCDYNDKILEKLLGTTFGISLGNQ